MKILYRFTDSSNGKKRPIWFDKRLALYNFLNRFDIPENEIFVFVDNASDDTFLFLKSIIREPDNHVCKTELGNAKSFFIYM